MLLENEGKPARDRLTLIRVFEELRALGYAGGYDALRGHGANWRKQRGASTAQAYIPLSFAPGEAYQFDWSHEVALMDGVTTTVKVAHVRLCHSRMMFVRAYPSETQEMVFDAHERAFAFFKGACTRGIYDNMKTAVDKIGRQGAAIQSPLPADVLAPPCRSRRLHASVGLGERSSREPSRACSRTLFHASAAVQEL